MNNTRHNITRSASARTTLKVFNHTTWFKTIQMDKTLNYLIRNNHSWLGAIQLDTVRKDPTRKDTTYTSRIRPDTTWFDTTRYDLTRQDATWNYRIRPDTTWLTGPDAAWHDLKRQNSTIQPEQTRCKLIPSDIPLWLSPHVHYTWTAVSCCRCLDDASVVFIFICYAKLQ